MGATREAAKLMSDGQPQNPVGQVCQVEEMDEARRVTEAGTEFTWGPQLKADGQALRKQKREAC
jgi:hypothetical protein